MVERSKLGKSGRPSGPSAAAGAGTEAGPEARAAANKAAARSDADRTVGDPDRKAVALTYAPDSADSAPVVSASGRGHLAERILEAAREAGVPIQEDPDLVELLAASEVGEEIPVEAFIAVAEILRYVYQANGRRAPQPGAPAAPPSGAGAGGPGGADGTV